MKKKKSMKKLTLSKETLRNLEGGLSSVRGGTNYTNYGCNTSELTYYNSCRIYCDEEPIRP
ncbi:MAG TPA: hypothetical protein VN493_31100 [Thermoanaerobaculia bacterium]|nr:hypothetical protein [Thermoanaerobaculia bacterium]